MSPKLLTEEDLALHNNERHVYAVDSQGAFIGLRISSDPAIAAVVSGPPSNPAMVFDLPTQTWVVRTAIEQDKQSAIDLIDRKAGEVRLRFITDVPGQQATYTVKGQQARTYLLALAYRETEPTSPVPEVPSFIAAEAQARGTTPEAAAQVIKTLADLWEGSIGPMIEQVRIMGKLGVEQAVSKEEVAQTLAQTIQQLDAIQ